MRSKNKNACPTFAQFWAKMQEFIEPFDEEDSFPKTTTRQKPTLGSTLHCLLFLLVVSAMFFLMMFFLSVSAGYAADGLALMQWTVPTALLLLLVSLLRCCSALLILRYGDTSLRRASLLGAYLLISLGVGFAVWIAVSALTGTAASTRTLLRITLLTVTGAVFIARIALSIAMPLRLTGTNSTRAEDACSEYTYVYPTNRDVALVLSRDEWAEFVKRYQEHIDAISQHLLAFDEEWAQEIGLSLPTLSGSATGVGVGDAALLPSHLCTGVSVFRVRSYTPTDCVCEQYVCRENQSLWRHFEDQDLAAIYAPEQYLCHTMKDYMRVFQELTDKYLPEDFDYAVHMGPLRIYDKDDGEWNFDRKEAETFVRHLEQFAVSSSSGATAEEEGGLPF